MGLFDDLIPKPTPDKPQGKFDDLIAEGKKQKELAAKTAVPGGMFADLIPGGAQQPTAAPSAASARQPAAIPEKPTAVKEYWDATKGAYTDITGEFKKGFGDKSPWELFKTESLPAHIVQGITRPANVALDVDEQGGLIGTDSSPPEAPKDKGDKTDPGVLADLRALGVTAKEHPGLVIGSLVKSIVADPELLLPWLWEAIPEATAAKVAQAARTMGASVDVAKAAEVGGRIAGRSAVGGAVSGTVEAADQFAHGDLDVGKIGSSAAEGAAISIPGRMAGKKVAEARIAEGVATPHEEAVVAGVADPVQGDMFNPTEAREAAKIPDSALTAMDTTREALAQATEHDPITPEMIAEVGKEPIRPPADARDRVVKAVKQAVVGGAIGAGVGYAVSNPDKGEIGAETGALIGAAFPLLKARRYLGPDISEIINARNGQVRSVARHVYQFQSQIEKAVPLKADREAISEMIDRGVEPAKDSPHYDAYRNLKDYFSQMGQLAKEAGVVEGLRDNYISHIVEEDKSVKAGFLAKIFGGGEGGGGKGGKSFGMERKYDTFEDLQNALKDSGLKLKTKDASEIAAIYGNAVYKSIADKRLIAALKETKLPDGSGLMVPVKDAPSSYIRMESPVLAGVAVHPDIAPDLKFVFNAHNPNWIMRKLSQVTSITKRIAVSTSLFHAKSLIDGMVPSSIGFGDTVNPIGAAKRALKMFKEGGNNDTIDKLIKGGLQIGTPEDVAGHEVQHGLDHFAEVINKRLPLRLTGLGYAAKALAKIDKAAEHLTFGFLQTGFKINVASSEFERLVGKGLEPARAAKLAASYTNDIFGSLDYYRVATDTDSHIMRKLGTASLNQNARRVLQLVMFAPDWTMATFRTLAKAMPGGATDAEMMQMHRRYLIKSAIYYMTFANALNYQFSGHSVFSNKNPTRVDMGDGRTMQFSKHDTEPLEWLRDPVNTAANKEAFLPATFNKLYRTHTDAAMRHKPEPTPVEDAKMLGEGMMPISLQQFVQNGMSVEDLSGALGMPIYGKSKDVKKERAATSKEKKIQESY